MRPLWTGKKLPCLVAALLLLTSSFGTVVADGGEVHPLEQSAGGYRVELSFEEPVKPGSNEIIITLETEHGDRVQGATIEVEVEAAEDHVEDEEDTHSDEQEPTLDDHDAPKPAPKADDHTDSQKTEPEVDEHDKAQSIRLESGHEAGEYTGSINFSKSGNWKITVHFEVDQDENKIEFPVEVPPGFSKAGVLTGFLGVNVAVVIAAAVQKRKLAAAAEVKKQAILAKKDGAAKKADLINTANGEELGRND